MRGYFHRNRQKNRIAKIAIEAATPPTTPPTIVPVIAFFPLGGKAVGVGAARTSGSAGVTLAPPMMLAAAVPKESRQKFALFALCRVMVRVCASGDRFCDV